MRRLIFHGSFLTSQKVTYAALLSISVSFSQFDEQFMGCSDQLMPNQAVHGEPYRPAAGSAAAHFKDTYRSGD
jgi:hypothetical protein